MVNKENQRIKLSKTLLKNSLIDLMHTKPIRKITIKEICENAQINRSTFYLYYSDQYALLNYIEKEQLHNVQEYLEKIDSNSSSLHYLQSLLSYIEDNADIFRTLLCHQESTSFQKDFIETAISSLKLRLPLNCSEYASGYVYSFLIMGCLSVITKWIESDFNISYKEMADLIFNLSDKAVSAFS